MGTKRIYIMKKMVLLYRNEFRVYQIIGIIGMSQANISKHLARLKDIVWKKCNWWICFRILHTLRRAYFCPTKIRKHLHRPYTPEN